MMPQEPVTSSNELDQLNGVVFSLAAVTSQPAEYIPIIEETLTVGKRVVETGQVRLVKTVHEDQQAVQIPLVSDQIIVERVLINELVDEPPTTRQEGDTVIYPVLKEEYVLVKRLRLVEEIRVTTRQVQTIENQTISLRREEMFIERTSIESSNERPDSSGISPSGIPAVAVDPPDQSSL